MFHYTHSLRDQNAVDAHCKQLKFNRLAVAYFVLGAKYIHIPIGRNCAAYDNISRVTSVGSVRFGSNK